MDSQVLELSRRLRRLEKQVLLSKQPTLGYSSIEDGAITAVDEDQNLTMVIGKQFDGTNTAASVTGPVPPQPEVPLVTEVENGLRVYWDGTWAVAGTVAPQDFARVTIHAAPLVGFPGTDPLDQTQIVGSWTEATGGERFVALPPGVDHIVYLVAWSQSGKFSTASNAALGTPLVISADLDPAVQTQLDDTTARADAAVVVYRQPTMPWANGSSQPANVIDDEWHDTSRGGLVSVWDGDEWVERPWGRDATADDIVAGKVIPVDELSELKWGVPDPSVAAGSATFTRLDGGYYGETLFPVTDSASLAAEHLSPSGWTLLWSEQKSDGWHTAIETFTDTESPTRSLVYIDIHDRYASWNQFSKAMAVIGNEVFILDFSAFAPNPNVLVYNRTTGAYIRSITGGAHAIGVDSDNATLLYGSITGSSPNYLYTVTKRSSATGAVTATVFSNAPYVASWYDYQDATIRAGNFDFGSARILMFGQSRLRSTGVVQTGETLTGKTHWDSTNGQFIRVYPYSISGQGGYASTRQVLSKNKTTVPNIRFKYTFQSSTTGEETAASPASDPISADPRYFVLAYGSPLPVLEENDPVQPDVIRLYASIDGGNYYLQPDVVEEDGTVYVDPSLIVTSGTLAPSVTTFTQSGEAGEWRSEYGGLRFKGDGTGAWPYLEKKINDRADDLYSPMAHNHDLLYSKIGHLHSQYALDSDLDAEALARVNADNALDGRLDTLEGQNLNGRLVSVEGVQTNHEDRLDDLETEAFIIRRPSHTVPNTTFTTVTGGTAESLNISSASGVHTIQVGGRYLVIWNCGFSPNSSGERIARVALNGSLWGQDRRQSAGGGGTRTIASFVQEGRFAVGDTIEFQAWQSSGGNLGVESDYSAASLRYVGP